MRRQASLGRYKQDTTRNRNSKGLLERAQIVEVYPERNTVDVRLLRNGELLQGIDGKYAIRTLKHQGGYNSSTKESYGEQVSMHKDDIVLLGYIDNTQAYPVVLGFLDYTENHQTPIQNESGRSIKVNPDQTYEKVWDDGNYERTFSQGFEVYLKQPIQPDFEGFSIGNLSQTTKETNQILGNFSDGFSYLKRLKTRTGDFIQAVLSSGLVKNTFESWGIRIGTTIDNDIYKLERIEEDKGTTLQLTKTTMDITQSMGGNSSITLTNGDTLLVSINDKCTIKISSSGDLEITNEGSTKVTSKGEVKVSSESSINLDAKGSLSAHSKGSMNLTSDSIVTINGSKVNIG